MGNRLGCSLLECHREDAALTEMEFTHHELQLIYEIYHKCDIVGILIFEKS
jgi:hypothetical protein